jgi:hypothetical protein
MSVSLPVLKSKIFASFDWSEKFDAHQLDHWHITLRIALKINFFNV